MNSALEQHPCFSKQGHQWFSYLHLPVAPKCNIKCSYCLRQYDCINENKPWAVSKVISPKQALKQVINNLSRDPHVKVIGIAGPGESLANNETFEALRIIHSSFPEATKCVSTNGLKLADSVDVLKACGVKTVSVTVNAVKKEVGRLIHKWALYNEHLYEGTQAAELIIERQIEGIKKAAASGILVKINTVLIPGVNAQYIADIALEVKQAGAYVMNIIPLFPQGEFSLFPAPDAKMLDNANKEVCRLFPKSSNCFHCKNQAAQFK